jgi:hypothetical protein
MAYIGLDYKIIRFSINTDFENILINPLKQERYNFKKAN